MSDFTMAVVCVFLAVVGLLCTILGTIWMVYK